MLNTAADFKRAKRRTKVIPVPEFEGDVIIQAFNAGHVFGAPVKEGDPDAIYKTLIASVVNEAGEYVFKETDIPDMKNLDFNGCVRLNNAIREFNRLEEDHEKKLRGQPFRAYGLRLSERMGMLYDDMMEQMPALEFLERMTLDRMDRTPGEAGRPAEQTPEEIMAMFPVTAENGG